jgi:hypothetical protein
MSPARKKFLIGSVVPLLTAVHLLAGTFAAQVGTNQSPIVSTNPLASGTAPPLPPVPKSPVDLFRELLAANLPQRKLLLANRPARNQELILQKVREYELLPPETRDLCLRQTELRWYLLPLLYTASTNRAAQLAVIPADLRPLLEAHLRDWDTLPATEQKELLEHQEAIQALAERARSRSVPPTNVPSTEPTRVVAAVAHWQALPEEDRQRIIGRFKQVFDLTREEQKETLKFISDPERKQIERTLKAFQNLKPEQRTRCVDILGKLAALSPDDREQFFKNADRWKQMSPTQRKAWRDLVRRLATSRPPVPPDAGQAPVPLLPGPRPRSPGFASTNQ